MRFNISGNCRRGAGKMSFSNITVAQAERLQKLVDREIGAKKYDIFIHIKDNQDVLTDLCRYDKEVFENLTYHFQALIDLQGLYEWIACGLDDLTER